MLTQQLFTRPNVIFFNYCSENLEGLLIQVKRQQQQISERKKQEKKGRKTGTEQLTMIALKYGFPDWIAPEIRIAV